MIDILKKHLKAKFRYDVEDYAVYEIHRGKSKVVLIIMILFLLALILYLLEVFGIFSSFINIGLVIFLLAMVISAPLTFAKRKYEAIIVTPVYLIQRVSKREFVVVEFDKITDFRIAEEGILIRENKTKLVLSTDLFQEEVEPIIEILEAKGKTFDKEKDFMIRPIHIVIEDNVVSIEDDEDVTETQKLHDKFVHEFPILTPGYIDEINFRNTMIDDVLFENGHVFMYMSSFEVRGGHPENTTFDNLKATDCILIIEKMVFKKLFQRDLNDKSKPIEELTLDTEEAIEYFGNAVVNEWKNKGKKMDMSFAAGVKQLHAEFTYDEIMVGWKQAK